MTGPEAMPTPVPWPEIVRDTAIAGFVAAMLTCTIIGLHTVSVNSVLTVETRFAEVGAAILLVMLGRFGTGMIRHRVLVPVIGLGLAVAAGGLLLADGLIQVVAIGGGLVLAGQAVWARQRPPGAGSAATEAAAAADRLAMVLQQSSGIVAPVLLGLVLTFPFWAPVLPSPFGGRAGLDIAILVFTYIMLGWGLNIIVGLAGLLDLGYVAFYAVGAYSYALLATTFDWSFWVCLPLAGVLAAFAGLVLGFPVLRLRGDYFAIVTLGFGEIIRIVLLNWYEVTKGPDGISSIPRPSFFGLAEFTPTPAEGVTAFHDLVGIAHDPIHRVVFLFYLIVALALLVNLVSGRIRNLPIGRSWEALREDDIACQALGINRRNIKLAAFTISAAFGGIAGSFFATRQGFISPESFTFLESAIILAIVVLGGMGSQAGVVLATVVMIGLPEVFRELEQYRMLVFGLAMVVIMVWRPRGLLAHREPSLRLHGKKGWVQRLQRGSGG